MLARLIDGLAPGVTRLIINANDDPGRFDGLGLPVVADCLPDHPGPLAGVLTALEWIAMTDPAIEWVVTVPGDVPFLPHDLVPRLHVARRRAQAVLACAGSPAARIRCGPDYGRCLSIRHDLRDAVVVQGIRRIDRFTGESPACAVSSEQWAADPVDPFFNVSTLEDLAEA